MIASWSLSPCYHQWYGLWKKKKEKRCIPKEGMPHAHKTCQKKVYSPYPWKKIKERDDSWQGVSHITAHSIHMHILITFVWFSFFMDSLFDFTTWEVQVCPIFLSYSWAPQNPFSRKQKGMVRIYTLSDSRESFEELFLAFWKPF